MDEKTKGRNGGDRATPKTSDKRNLTRLAPRIKLLIAGAFLGGDAAVMNEALLHLRSTANPSGVLS